MARPFPHVDGVEHRFVDAAGLQMHVAEAGPPDAPPVLMLHGWPQHWYEWRHQIPPLAERYRVIAPDLRGFGWSAAPPSGYDKENMATDVLNLLDALGVQRVRLIGHDWGGWIGFILCVRAPERFSRFLALNIPPLWQKLGPGTLAGSWRFWYQWVLATPGLGQYVVTKRNFVGSLIRKNTATDTWSDAELAEFTEVLREPARAHATTKLYRTFVVREFAAVAGGRYNSKRLTVPTRLVFGADDFAIPRAFLPKDTSAFADDFELELVPSTGHFIVDEKPELVTQKAA
jgi:pimeloyl-ACP methyl ester carboxylesterase